MDTFSREKRSEIMSHIRSKWTSHEAKMHGYLKSRKIRHSMHPKIDGSPDIILKDRKIAIFLHGCFWHKCLKHYKEPKSRTEYWLPKIERNARRDRKNTKMLKGKGWKVLRIWEHDIRSKKKFPSVMKRIEKMLVEGV